MSMLPGNYKNVLNKANGVLAKFRNYTQETMPMYFMDEIKEALIEVCTEIGRLEVFISSLKNPSEYYAIKEDLERVKQNLYELL